METDFDQDIEPDFDKENSPDESLAGEVGELSKEDTLNARLRRYEPLKARALDMVDYIGTLPLSKQKESLRKGIHECGEFLLFRDYYEKHQVRLHKASFCKNHLLCPLCGLRRAVKYLQAYEKRFKSIKLEHPEITPYLVTYTVKDGPDLRERFRHLRNNLNLQKIRRAEAARGSRPLIQMNKALGGVDCYEFKKGSGSGEWHPHNHGIWLCRERPYQTEAQAEWKEITGDSFIVDMRPIDQNKTLLEGFMEVFRYALKPSTLSLEEQYEAAQTLKGKRLINSFGIFRGVEIPESLEDEPIDGAPFIEILFQFLRISGYSFIKKDPRR